MDWTHGEQGMLPEARTRDLLVEHVVDETVVYDLDSKDVHCLTPLAAAVFEHCDGRTTTDRIAQLAQERLGEPVGPDEVSAALAQLEERSLLEAPPLVLHEGLSRRDLVRRSALTGAAVAMAPLITSIAAPTAAMASSHTLPAGCTCTKNPDCASNHCCQSVRVGRTNTACNNGCCVLHDNSCQLRTDSAGNPICSVVLANCSSINCPGSTRCCTST